MDVVKLRHSLDKYHHKLAILMKSAADTNDPNLHSVISDMIELIALTEEQIKQASRLSEVRDSSDSDQNGSSEEEHLNGREQLLAEPQPGIIVRFSFLRPSSSVCILVLILNIQMPEICYQIFDLESFLIIDFSWRLTDVFPGKNALVEFRYNCSEFVQEWH